MRRARALPGRLPLVSSLNLLSNFDHLILSYFAGVAGRTGCSLVLVIATAFYECSLLLTPPAAVDIGPNLLPGQRKPAGKGAQAPRAHGRPQCRKGGDVMGSVDWDWMDCIALDD